MVKPKGECINVRITFAAPLWNSLEQLTTVSFTAKEKVPSISSLWSIVRSLKTPNSSTKSLVVPNCRYSNTRRFDQKAFNALLIIIFAMSSGLLNRDPRSLVSRVALHRPIHKHRTSLNALAFTGLFQNYLWLSLRYPPRRSRLRMITTTVVVDITN